MYHLNTRAGEQLRSVSSHFVKIRLGNVCPLWRLWTNICLFWHWHLANCQQEKGKNNLSPSTNFPSAIINSSAGNKNNFISTHPPQNFLDTIFPRHQHYFPPLSSFKQHNILNNGSPSMHCNGICTIENRVVFLSLSGDLVVKLVGGQLKRSAWPLFQFFLRLPLTPTHLQFRTRSLKRFFAAFPQTNCQ